MRRKRPRAIRARDIALDICILLLVAACALLYWHGSAKFAARRAEIEREGYASDALPREKRQRGQAIFDELRAELGELLPGVACRGDAELIGTANVNLATALRESLLSAVCGDLRDDFLSAAGLRVPVSSLIAVHDLGIAGEGLCELAARTGAWPMAVGEPFAIPESTDPVAVSLTSDVGRAIHLNGESYARLGRVSIAGVNGYFYPGSQAADQRDAGLAFGRELSGEGKAVAAGTPVIIEAVDRFKSCVPVLFIREQADVSVEESVDILQSILDRHDSPGGCFVIACDTPKDSPLDAALKAAFGERYIRCDSGNPDFGMLADRIVNLLDMQGALEAPRAAVDVARSRLDEITQ